MSSALEVARLERLRALSLGRQRLFEKRLAAHRPTRLALLLPREELDLEDERGAARDLWRRAVLAVRVVGAAREHALLALVHRHDALVPALDHTADADVELKESGPIARAVELLAVEKGAHVVHLDLGAGRRRAGRGIAWDQDLFEETAVTADVFATKGDRIKAGRLVVAVAV